MCTGLILRPCITTTWFSGRFQSLAPDTHPPGPVTGRPRNSPARDIKAALGGQTHSGGREGSGSGSEPWGDGGTMGPGRGAGPGAPCSAQTHSLLSRVWPWRGSLGNFPPPPPMPGAPLGGSAPESLWGRGAAPLGQGCVVPKPQSLPHDPSAAPVPASPPLLALG